MSITAGGLCLILQMLRPLTEKYFTATWHYYSKLMMYSFFIIPYYKIIALFHLDMGSNQLIQFNSIAELASNNTGGVKVGRYVEAFFDFVPYLLMTVTLILIAIILIKNYQLKRRIINSSCIKTTDEQTIEILFKCKQEINITRNISLYVSSYISTPFVYGIFKPHIVLPDNIFSPEELRYIFIHELTHWKRGDTRLKGVMLFINALHWFNPLAYVARRDIDRFCELSCDERVITSMNHEERMQYIELILYLLWKIADCKTKLYPAFGNEKEYLEKRISMILNQEISKCKKSMVAISIMLTVLLSAMSSVMAYTADVNQIIKNVKGVENIIEESVDGFSLSDDSDSIFLDSYFK